MRRRYSSGGQVQLTRHAAIDFIVAQLAEEAARQAIPLSEIEREVLHFSESSQTPAKMIELMETFDRDYDQATYERKIVRLLKGAYKHTRSSRKDEWIAAIRRLEDVDVYLGVMVNQTGLFRPAGDVWRLFGTAFGLIGLIVVFLFFVEPVLGRYLTPEQQGFYAWLSAVVAGSLYTVARWIFGATAVDHVIDRLIDAITFRPLRETRRKSDR